MLLVQYDPRGQFKVIFANLDIFRRPRTLQGVQPDWGVDGAGRLQLHHLGLTFSINLLQKTSHPASGPSRGNLLRLFNAAGSDQKRG